MRKDILSTLILFGTFTVLMSISSCILIIDSPTFVTEKKPSKEENNVVNISNKVVLYTSALEDSIIIAKEYVLLKANDSSFDSLILELEKNISNGEILLKNKNAQKEIDATTNRINYIIGAIDKSINNYDELAQEYIAKLKSDNSKLNIEMAKRFVAKLPNGKDKDKLASEIVDYTAPVIEVLQDSVFNIGIDIYENEQIVIHDNYDDIDISHVDIRYYLSKDEKLTEVNKFAEKSSLDDYVPGTYVIYFSVKDNSGNVGYAKRKIVLLDKSNPEFALIKEFNYTNNCVRITIKTNEDVQDLKDFHKVSSREFYKDYYSNAKEEFYLYDFSNNKSKVLVDIDLFDNYVILGDHEIANVLVGTDKKYIILNDKKSYHESFNILENTDVVLDLNGSKLFLDSNINVNGNLKITNGTIELANTSSFVVSGSLLLDNVSGTSHGLFVDIIGDKASVDINNSKLNLEEFNSSLKIHGHSNCVNIKNSVLNISSSNGTLISITNGQKNNIEIISSNVVVKSGNVKIIEMENQIDSRLLVRKSNLSGFNVAIDVDDKTLDLNAKIYNSTLNGNTILNSSGSLSIYKVENSKLIGGVNDNIINIKKTAFNNILNFNNCMLETKNKYVISIKKNDNTIYLNGKNHITDKSKRLDYLIDGFIDKVYPSSDLKMYGKESVTITKKVS